MHKESSMASTSFHTDRRSLVKAGAWTVPAVTVAASSPFLAASTPPVIISDNVLILSDFGAKRVICGDSTWVDTSVTITVTNGAPLVDATIQMGIFPPGTTDEDVASLQTFQYESQEFNEIQVAHVETEVEDNSTFTGGILGVLLSTSSHSGGGGLSLNAQAAPTTVTKGWALSIEDADPETYEIANFEYEWVFYAESGGVNYYFIRGSFDVGSQRCGNSRLEGTAVRLSAGVWRWTETVDANGHVDFTTEGAGGTTRGGDLGITMGEWSTSLPVP